MESTILLFGCGKMGMALLDGWLEKGYTKERIQVIETNDTIRMSLEQKGIQNYKHFDLIGDVSKNSIIIFAVKPQVLFEMLEDCKRFKLLECIFLSIAAGVRIDYISKYIGREKPIFRAMPNTPVAVSEGMTAIYKNKYCLEEKSIIIEQLLNSVGEVVWVNNEEDIDIVTSISGSGPAYFFYLTECLIKIGVSLGLSLELSKKLSIQTFFGSSKLLKSSNHSPDILRKNVTSKGGTTEAALKILMNKENM